MVNGTRNSGFAIGALCAAAAALLLPASASALITLTDGTSQIDIDETSQAGVFDWMVAGTPQDQLAKEWFWYRVGPTGGETSVDALGAPVVNSTGANNVELIYTSSGQFSIILDLTLTGAPTPSDSDMLSETITIHNLTGSFLDFHFFEYTDLDLFGTPGDDTGQFLPGGGSVTQSDTIVSLHSQTNATAPSAHQIGLSGAILALLTDGAPTTLNDFDGPVNGNVEWAFQWNADIEPKGSFSFTKTKFVTPEPGSAALLGIGLFGLGMLGRRRRARS